uniref:Suppressor APC domain containing 2 n=1 Tax=Cyclopterus lumpus TaxID=8103 RepID=A0A8C2ZEU6_CYCLU
MALIATDQGCKLNGTSAIYGRTEYSTDGLPKAFLHSLRTLFNILDDAGRGYVHISEIETRWQGADTRDLPGGVLGCLRRVTPPHGCLTFERFVAGLRYSMLNPEHSTHFRVRPLGPSNVTNTQQHRASSLQSRARSEEVGPGYPVCGPVRPSRAGSGPLSPWLWSHRVVRSGLPRSQSESATGFNGGSRRHGRSREEQRRHTISNGVDYGMLKQMKELEQEKDSLLAGLEVVERARDWYQGQIHNVTERQRQVGQSSQSTDFFTEANQSRMNVLIPKLQEVNRCLNDLISCSGISFPSGSAQTAANPQPPGPAPPQAIQRLKDQNRLLTQEVTERSERIAQLEQEKSAAQDTSTMDSTFI